MLAWRRASRGNTNDPSVTQPADRRWARSNRPVWPKPGQGLDNTNSVDEDTAWSLQRKPASDTALMATRYSGERRRQAATSDALAGGRRVGRQEVTRSDPRRFFDVGYAIPRRCRISRNLPSASRPQAESRSQPCLGFA